MDKNTYGDSRAAINLVQMIEDHPQSKIVSKKVGRLLETFFHRANSIELLDNRSDIEHLYMLLIKDIGDEPIKFPPFDYSGDEMLRVAILETKIETHVLNVIRRRFKQWLNGERTKRRSEMNSKQFCEWLEEYLDGKAGFGGLSEIEVDNIRYQMDLISESPLKPKQEFLNPDEYI